DSVDASLLVQAHGQVQAAGQKGGGAVLPHCGAEDDGDGAMVCVLHVVAAAQARQPCPERGGEHARDDPTQRDPSPHLLPPFPHPVCPAPLRAPHDDVFRIRTGPGQPPKMVDHLEARLWRTRTVAPCPVPVMTKCGAGGLGRESTSARRVPNQVESRSTSAVAPSGRIRSPVPQSHTRWILVTGAARRASRKSRRVAPNLLSISIRAGACQSPLRMTGPPLELITIGEGEEVPVVCP